MYLIQKYVLQTYFVQFISVIPYVNEFQHICDYFYAIYFYIEWKPSMLTVSFMCHRSYVLENIWWYVLENIWPMSIKCYYLSVAPSLVCLLEHELSLVMCRKWQPYYTKAWNMMQQLTCLHDVSLEYSSVSFGQIAKLFWLMGWWCPSVSLGFLSVRLSVVHIWLTFALKFKN